MTLANIRDTDLIALAQHAERLLSMAHAAYYSKPFSRSTAEVFVRHALNAADEVTACADRIRDRMAMKDEPAVQSERSL